MTARHNVYIFHCFTTLHPQGGLIINKLLLLGKFIILLLARIRFLLNTEAKVYSFEGSSPVVGTRRLMRKKI